MSKEPRIIYAEDGEEFQQYVDEHNKPIKCGTPIGIEFYVDGEWKLTLLTGIYYRNDLK